MLRQEDYHWFKDNLDYIELKANLGYIVKSSPAWATIQESMLTVDGKSGWR